MDTLGLDTEKPPEMEVDLPSSVVNPDDEVLKDEVTLPVEDGAHGSPELSRSPTQSIEGLGGGRRSSDEVGSVLFSRSLETNMDRLTLKQLHEVMEAGKWGVHEALSAPVCISATSRGKREGDGYEDCDICIDYVEHVCNGIRDDDGSLDTAIKLRTHWLTMTHREGDRARLEGEICAVRRVLRDREEELQKQRSELIEVTAERIAHKIETKKAWDVVKDFKKRIDKLEVDLKEVRAQVDRVDESRARKTPHVSTIVTTVKSSVSASNVVDDTSVLSSAAPAEEDIVMAEVRQPNVEVDWKNLTGIPRMSIKNFVPTTLADYQDAYQYMHDYPCYPVGLAVFGEYMQACTAKSLKKDLTDIQQWALDYFQLPSWLWAIFQSFNVDATALAANRRFWQVARYLRYDDDVRVWAAFIQKGGCPPDGIEFVDEFGTLDSQLIRGLKLWNGLTYPKLGKGYSSTHQKDADGWWAVTRALLYVVLYPDTYAASVRQEKLTIATEVNVEPWITNETVSEEQVTRRFARMGVTVPMVEDMYRYVLKFAENLLDSPKKLGDKNELRDMIASSKAVIEKAGSTPPGLSALYDEFIPRPPGLPWPDSHMNKVQERGAFLLDIPLRVRGGDVKKVTLRPLPTQLTGPRANKPPAEQSHKPAAATGGKEKLAVVPVATTNKLRRVRRRRVFRSLSRDMRTVAHRVVVEVMAQRIRLMHPLTAMRSHRRRVAHPRVWMNGPTPTLTHPHPFTRRGTLPPAFIQIQCNRPCTPLRWCMTARIPPSTLPITIPLRRSPLNRRSMVPLTLRTFLFTTALHLLAPGAIQAITHLNRRPDTTRSLSRCNSRSSSDPPVCIRKEARRLTEHTREDRTTRTRI
ncbi:hypothetical protein DFH06DRAFT_1318017 [Mycena polygramma]|nr:hypothetical protein DFH06DRAFT_1318017 [Mycena polygramma]